MELPTIPTDTRLNWIEILTRAASRRPNPETLARAAENAAHLGRVRRAKIEGLDVCVYGQRTVLCFEAPSVHALQASMQYCNAARRSAWILDSDAVLDTDTAWWSMTDEEVAEFTPHAAWKASFLAAQERARATLRGDSSKVGLFACPKCRSMDVDTDQKQTRSADEPMTIFCGCNACGKRFVR